MKDLKLLLQVAATFCCEKLAVWVRCGL